MATVVLTIHLLLAFALIVVVLLQRSEGGGLGIGGGGGGVMSGRGAATALAKVTWVLGAAFVVTSIALTVLAAQDTGSGSVIDQLGGSDATAPAAPGGLPDLGDDLLPPAPDVGDDLAPPAPDASGDPVPPASDAAPVPEAAPEGPTTPPPAE